MRLLGVEQRTVLKACSQRVPDEDGIGEGGRDGRHRRGIRAPSAGEERADQESGGQGRENLDGETTKWFTYAAQ
jgi:hypothetical protein